MNLDNYKMYVTTGRGMGKTWFNDAWKKAVLGEDDAVENALDYWRKGLIDTVAIEENLKKEGGINTLYAVHTDFLLAIERMATYYGLCFYVDEADFTPLDTAIIIRFVSKDNISVQYTLEKHTFNGFCGTLEGYAHEILKNVMYQIDRTREKKDKERLETAMKNTCKVEYNSYSRNRHAQIKNVLFNPPATIVFWTDYTKTVVKAVNEDFDPEKGLDMAIAKKHFGNEGNYFNQIKKWTEKYESEHSRVNELGNAFMNGLAAGLKEANEKATESMKALVETIEKHTSGDD